MTAGLPIPYTPATDDWIAATLLLCFFWSAFVLSRNRQLIAQRLKDFIFHRERISIFTTATPADMRYLVLLIGQSCLLSGICVFCHFQSVHPTLLEHVPVYLLLPLYAGSVLLYICAKQTLYALLGWIFFDRRKKMMWLGSYSTLLHYLGFVLFPFVLLFIYAATNLQTLLMAGLFLVILFKILTFYKWFKLFCNHLHGSYRLILYFCALEIMPCLVWYQGMSELTDYLTTNF